MHECVAALSLSLCVCVCVLNTFKTLCNPAWPGGDSYRYRYIYYRYGYVRAGWGNSSEMAEQLTQTMRQCDDNIKEWGGGSSVA